MALHQRLQRRVDRRRRGTPVLADDRVQPVRERERHSGQLLRQQLADALFVHRVHDRPQQADGDRCDLAAAHLGERREQRRLVERHRYVSLRVDPLLHFEGQAPGNVGRRVRVAKIERVELAALPQDERVGMPGGRQKRGSGGRSGQDRVRALRRPVDEHRRVSQQRIERQPVLGGTVAQRLGDAVEHALRGRRRLADPQLAAGGVGDDDVGERATGVDGDAKAHRLLIRYRVPDASPRRARPGASRNSASSATTIRPPRPGPGGSAVAPPCSLLGFLGACSRSRGSAAACRSRPSRTRASA